MKIFNLLSKSFINALLILYTLLITHASANVDAELKPYFNRFVDFSKQCGYNINTSEIKVEFFDDTVQYRVALCYRNVQLVQVDRKSFGQYSTEREQIIFHELGHCLLDKDHDDKDWNIMNTEGFLDDYKQNYDMYIRKLFDKCTKPVTDKFTYKDY